MSIAIDNKNCKLLRSNAFLVNSSMFDIVQSVAAFLLLQQDQA